MVFVHKVDDEAVDIHRPVGLTVALVTVSIPRVWHQWSSIFPQGSHLHGNQGFPTQVSLLLFLLLLQLLLQLIWGQKHLIDLNSETLDWSKHKNTSLIDQNTIMLLQLIGTQKLFFWLIWVQKHFFKYSEYKKYLFNWFEHRSIFSPEHRNISSAEHKNTSSTDLCEFL